MKKHWTKTPRQKHLCLFRIELNRPSGRKKASDLRSLAFLALKGCHTDLVFLLEQKTLGISIHRSTEICLAVIALDGGSSDLLAHHAKLMRSYSNMYRKAQFSICVFAICIKNYNFPCTLLNRSNSATLM